MGSLFEVYDALARSGLFDPDYYCARNPEVAAANLDPLLHYIEEGARQGFNPHPEFDAGYYLEQCAQSGECPENPLLHYITVGTGRGLERMRRREAAAAAAPDAGLKLYIDAPRPDDATRPIAVERRLSIAGWALARRGVAAIDIAIDGMRLLSAQYGIERRDVAAAYPDWDEARRSGFAATIPHRSLAPGTHQVGIILRDTEGAEATASFGIDVAAPAPGAGPGTLRLKMTEAEADLARRTLAQLDWQPFFRVVLLAEGDAAETGRLRATLASLGRQVYEDFGILLVARGGNGRRVPGLDGFDDIADRVEIERGAKGIAIGAAARKARGRPVLVCLLRAGDVLGCDALLEFALASGMNRDADFFYGDDRRCDPGGAVAPFFKPDWSPDLLLATNYIGRFWCASAPLLARAGVTLETLCAHGDYDAVLRCTEAANAVCHVGAVLHERAGRRRRADAGARAAIAAALVRRGIEAGVVPGRLPETHRVRRALAAGELVSIIIPTSASPPALAARIAGLRAVTAHRRYEIICVGDGASDAARTADRGDHAADKVIPCAAPTAWPQAANLAAAQAQGRYLLFLDERIEVVDPDWLEALLEHGQRPEIGAVGPMILDPDRRIRQAGMFLAAPGAVRHAFRGCAEHEPGYFGLAQTERNVIAVSAACLLTRRETFVETGGFDLRHAGAPADLDYGLRLWQRGLLNLYTPHARVIQHGSGLPEEVPESGDAGGFAARWRSVVRLGDPFFHPRLSPSSDDIEPEREPVERVFSGHPILARDKVRRILAVKLDHIGDCVMALPALRRLKQHFPAARLSVLSGPWARAVWALEPCIDEVIDFEFYFAVSGRGARAVSDRAFERLGARLAPHRFDLALDLRKIPDTRPVLQYAGARWLAGFEFGGQFPWLDIALEWDGDRALVAKRQHIGDDLVNLVDAIAAAGEPDRQVIARPAAAPRARLAGVPERLFAKPVVCIHPAAGNPLRQWPERHFAALIDLLVERRGVNVALIGRRGEERVARAILAQVAQRDAVFPLLGKVELSQLPSLLTRCVLFVGNNSGPKHIAAGLGVPTVAVHSGIVDCVEWGPLGPNAVALWRDMTCAPCYLQTVQDCPRGLACLTGLAAGAVYRACERMLPLASVPPGTVPPAWRHG
ncbi:MAG TPA: glycosyltransferase family 9 protein [Stellaceae bacterium]|nr:glycosyltransferase family 9 protein [Stellaceae bacterium]